MAKKKADALEERSFGLLGISEAEERAYRWLLTHPSVTAGEVSQALSLSIGKTRQLLSAIEAKGLVSRTLERPYRYLPVTPDIGLESLILQHQAELQHIRGAVRGLQAMITNRQVSREEKPTIEVVSSQEALRRIFRQASLLAQNEILCFTRLPVVGSMLAVPTDEDNYEQRQAQAKGVRIRSIVDKEFLEMPLAIERVRYDMAAGEKVRVAPNVPLKMVLIDRRIAIILQGEGPSLVLRYLPLLEALHALFELSWRQATPVTFTRSGKLETLTYKDKVPQDAEEILSFLATGINDKSIIHELGVSRATYGRRIAELMKILDASSRFQLGWRTAELLSPKIPRQ